MVDGRLVHHDFDPSLPRVWKSPAYPNLIWTRADSVRTMRGDITFQRALIPSFFPDVSMVVDDSDYKSGGGLIARITSRAEDPESKGQRSVLNVFTFFNDEGTEIVLAEINYGQISFPKRLDLTPTDIASALEAFKTGLQLDPMDVDDTSGYIVHSLYRQLTPEQTITLRIPDAQIVRDEQGNPRTKDGKIWVIQGRFLGKS